jgi:hypothetical protein
MTTYNVLINSNNRIAGGTTTSSARYYFDFGALPECDYLLSWGFVSSNVNTSINRLGLLSINLGQCSVYTASSTNIRATTTNYIGTIIPNENDVSSFLYGDSNTNNKIMLKRPNNNEFTVEIRAIDGSLWVDSVGNAIPEYLLALNFEKISLPNV